MKNTTEMKQYIASGSFDSALSRLYSETELCEQRDRYVSLAETFASVYGERDNIRFFSAPGRTEVCGNHTDHNKGCVLAAGINLDAIACVSANDDNTVRLKSVEYPKEDVVDLSVLTPAEEEKEHSASLIRGVAARFVQLGYKIGGFDCVTTNKVIAGSGLSSSAAFEVLVGTIFNYMYNDGKISAVEIAKIAQYAENVFFGKPCGLMDQTACSVGGFVQIDFADTEKPVITPVSFDFGSCGHALVITDTRASHADLTDEYAAIRKEMEAVASCFGKSCLRETDEKEFFANMALVREKCGERACLRAIHFFNDNRRVEKEAAALKNGDFETFKKYVIESGNSSYMYNQNVFVKIKDAGQPVSLALALSDSVLNGKGAWRVHGGGFAGTIQAFVPNDLLDCYISTLESVFGAGACHVLSIRSVGGTEVC